MSNNKRLMALLLSGLVGAAQGGEKEELLKLRNTTTNLIKQLVKQGVITDQMAEQMIKQAEADAEQQAAQHKAASAAKETVPADEVRVAYVPDFVKDEIRQQVRSELREEVVGDVMQKAKNEQWGLPNALPEWTRKIKLSGDIRLRSRNDYMAKDNINRSIIYPDVMSINDIGSLNDAIAQNRAYQNTQTDRHRFQERFRLGLDADVAPGLTAGVRLATGNMNDPVSTNQTLGQTGQSYEFNLDRAYLKYDFIDDDKFKWLTLSGGRIKNPWETGGSEFTGGSELLWDTDLSFEGFVATVRHRLGSDGHMDIGGENVPMVYATAGVFPLQEFDLTQHDKWMLGGQVGVDWNFASQDNMKFNLGYFDFSNVTAVPNTKTDATGRCDASSESTRASRPQFTQGGNSLAAICYVDPTVATPDVGLYGLASEFKVVNISAAYDLALFSPIHLRLMGDYAKNIGFDAAKVKQARSLTPNAATVTEQTNAWQFRADLGWNRLDAAGNWNTFVGYKYVERDAVLDAYTDSDFHGAGGTNVKGWFIGGNYSLMKNVWLTGRWLSADIITGPPYGVDVLQIDVNTKF